VAQADAILRMEIKRQNLKLNRSSGKISPRSLEDPVPPWPRYEISSTLRKRITIVHHPKRQFWVADIRFIFS